MLVNSDKYEIELPVRDGSARNMRPDVVWTYRHESFITNNATLPSLIIVSPHWFVDRGTCQAPEHHLRNRQLDEEVAIYPSSYAPDDGYSSTGEGRHRC